MNAKSNKIKEFFSMPLYEKEFVVANKFYKLLREKVSAAHHYVFENRSRSCDNLILIFIEANSNNWNITLSKIKEGIDISKEQFDVCICVFNSNEYNCNLKRLKEIAHENSWSILFTYEKQESIALETAINLHPVANWIYKIDDNILVPSNYFEQLKLAYKHSVEAMPIYPGFLLPCVDVSTTGSISFLKAINQWNLFVNQFDKNGFYLKENNCPFLLEPFLKDKKIISWIDERTTPFEEVANIVFNNNHDELLWTPFKVSTEAILFERAFAEGVKKFNVGTIGSFYLNDDQLNGYCMANNLGIYIDESLLVKRTDI